MLGDYLFGQAPSWMSTEQAEELKNRQMMGLAGHLLQASGPSRMPVNLGQGLGGAILGSLQQRRSAISDIAQTARLQETEEPYKIGTVREFKIGEDVITREYTGKGQWRQISKGPRWDTEKSTPSQLQMFEAVTPGFSEENRGTEEYSKAFDAFRDKMYENKSILGTTPDGNIITFNSKSKELDTINVESDILPKTKKIMGEETLKEIGTLNGLLGGIGEIRKLAKGNMQFVGPLEGNWNKLKSVFADNKDFTMLDREVESLITMAYALSGKQISEKEMSMLKRAILPSVTQPGANFIASLDHAEKWLTRNKTQKLKMLKSSGYRVGKELEGREEKEDYDYIYDPKKGLL